MGTDITTDPVEEIYIEFRSENSNDGIIWDSPEPLDDANAEIVYFLEREEDKTWTLLGADEEPVKDGPVFNSDEGIFEAWMAVQRWHYQRDAS